MLTSPQLVGRRCTVHDRLVRSRLALAHRCHCTPFAQFAHEDRLFIGGISALRWSAGGGRQID